MTEKMCKVIQFQFTCHHSLKFRKSRCGGTYHKPTRSSIKAACCAEAYIILKVPHSCGKCQQDAWTSSWKRKLDRATSFRNRLMEKGSPGAAEISSLVSELENEYANAAWDVRQHFPPANHRTTIERVKFKEKVEGEVPKPPKSPLKLEIYPEDVVVKETKRMKTETEDADDDYVRSTDPMHPITTDYSHPLDNLDDSWVLEYLSSEDLEASAAIADGFDFASDGWDWGGSANVNGTADTDDWSSHEPSHANGSSELTVWGPDAEATPSSAVIGMNGLQTKEDVRKAQIEEAIKAFWEVVNTDTKDQQPQHPSTPIKQPPKSLLESPSVPQESSNCMPDCDTDAFKSDSDGCPEYLWTDGPSDEPFQHTASPLALTLPPSPNSTRSKFDKMRRQIHIYKDTNKERFYSKWLQISRMEIRQFEGPESQVLDPARLRNAKATSQQ